jgi:predicted Zn-dependent protease
MTGSALRYFRALFKSFCLAAALAACSVNPATGDKQFTALMSPAQEVKVGAQEHAKILQEFGTPANDAVQAYVEKVGARVSADTERPDVQYRFFVLDSPIVNAFAIPGGYVYVTRGLLAQANSEAELAGVLGHEVGHITARHAAERYSSGVLTSLGAAVITAALDDPAAANVIGTGTNLFMTSYSRSQESQADSLGVRYMHHAGYDPYAMASFLQNLEDYTSLENRLSGKGESQDFDYFSTHPQTADRVADVTKEAAQYPPNQKITGRDEYLKVIDGLTWGDSASHGFVRGQDFYHPGMGFTFRAPPGWKIDNRPEQVVATGPGGGALIFDAVVNKTGADAYTYMTQSWMHGEALEKPEKITVNGLPGATASFAGRVGGQPVTIRVVAVSWQPGMIYRFQMSIPQNAPAETIEELKKTTYSLRSMTAQEKASVRPYRIKIVTAGPRDTVAGLAGRMAFPDLKEERFRTLNALKPGDKIVPGQAYKIIVD